MYNPRATTNGSINKLSVEDNPAHAWYRFILSFPPHLVRDYIERFEVTTDKTVLDPFCGTGTVLVECKKLGIRSLGIEANPMVYLASKVKVDWSPDPGGLREHALGVARLAQARLVDEGLEDAEIFAALRPRPKRLLTLPEEK